MPKHVYLIDYENIQNLDLTPLLDQDVLIKVFCGENQKYTGKFFDSAMEFGKEKMDRIEISGSGKNAADFHIAYFIGKLSKELIEPHFHIISKDTGFKPLVDYLTQKDKVACQQESKIAVVAQSKKIAPKQARDNYQRVVENLAKTPEKKKPKTMEKLRHHVNSLTGKKIGEEEIEKIVERLKVDKKISVDENGKISY
jgi:hypothetical protein